MTDLDTQLRAKQPEHDEQARLMADFLARGGQVERLPNGAMVETGWTGKQFAQSITNTATAARKEKLEAEAEAKRQEADAKLAQRLEHEAEQLRRKAEQPKSARRGRPKGSGSRNGPRMTKQALQIMRLLGQHPTMPSLVEATGKARGCVWTILNNLRRKGLIESDGRARILTTWTLTDAGRAACR